MPRDNNYCTKVPRKNDWKCPNCPNYVYSHKLQCQCGYNKYTKSAAYLNLIKELEPIFWVCVDCNSKWQNDVKNCLKCNKSYNN